MLVISALEQFSSDARVLTTEIANARSLAAAVEPVQGALARLSAPDSPFIGGLTRSQSTLALTVIGQFRKWLTELVANGMDLTPFPSPNTVQPSVGPSGETFRLPLGPVAAGIAVAGVVGGSMPPGMAAITVGASAGYAITALTGFVQARTTAGKGPSPLSRNHSTAPGLYSFLLALTEEFLRNVDELVCEMDRGKPTISAPVRPRIEDHDNVLRFLQRLLAVRSRTKNAVSGLDDKLLLTLDEDLPDLLSEFGIRAVTYTPGETSATYFDFEPNHAATELETPRTLEPALIKGDVVVRRGRVVRP